MTQAEELISSIEGHRCKPYEIVLGNNNVMRIWELFQEGSFDNWYIQMFDGSSIHTDKPLSDKPRFEIDEEDKWDSKKLLSIHRLLRDNSILWHRRVPRG